MKALREDKVAVNWTISYNDKITVNLFMYTGLYST